MSSTVRPPVAPMLAKLQEQIPEGSGWRYEPKWDGIRTLVFREPGETLLISREDRPLGRYFPETLAALDAMPAERFVADGELVIVRPEGLAFDELLQRIHPAASRVRMLAEQWPATLVLFDLLARGDRPGRDRGQARGPHVPRGRARHGEGEAPPHRRLRRRWLPAREVRGRCRQLVARALRRGAHAALRRTHLVVQSRRASSAARDPPSAGGRRELRGRAFARRAEPMDRRSGPLMGRAPTELVCEVRFDRMQGERFRHAATFLRWRPDREPRSCTFAQLSGGTSAS